MAEEIGFENGRNSNFEGMVSLTLTLDPAIRHTVMHHSSTSTYIPNFIQIEETLWTNGRTYGRTDVRTDVRTDIFPPLILLGRLLEVDLHTTKHKTEYSSSNTNQQIIKSILAKFKGITQFLYFKLNITHLCLASVTVLLKTANKRTNTIINCAERLTSVKTVNMNKLF